MVGPFLVVQMKNKRKKDQIWSQISSLRKFEKFLVEGGWLTPSNEFEDMISTLKSHLHPLTTMHTDRLAMKRIETAQEIEDFCPEEYSLLVDGDEFDEIITSVENTDLDQFVFKY